MSYSLFLDDERFPKTKRDWVICRTVQAALDHIYCHGMPNYISFDNDLKKYSKEGIDFAKMLIEKDMDMDYKFIPPDFDFNVHSANSQAGPLIESKLRQYINYRKQYLD